MEPFTAAILNFVIYNDCSITEIQIQYSYYVSQLTLAETSGQKNRQRVLALCLLCLFLLFGRRKLLIHSFKQLL